MTFGPFPDPRQSLEGLQDELNRVVERVFHGGPPTGIIPGLCRTPAVDLYEYADRYVLYADVPGLSAKAIELSYLNDMLTIRGTREAPGEESKDRRELRTERRRGEFSRSVAMPAGVDDERIGAKCHDGVLEVTLFKSSTDAARTVKVETG